jgi:ferritin-like metal-binding protein YciE
MAKQSKKLDELFHDTLKDIFYAEKKILAALPKMAKAAQTPELKAAFEKHHRETEQHVTRLEQVFELIEKRPQGKKCPAIDGIVEEGQEIAKEYKGSPALDSGLLAAAQAVEHYEISRYGTLRTWAQELGLGQALQLLETTLREEKKTDETLKPSSPKFASIKKRRPRRRNSPVPSGAQPRFKWSSAPPAALPFIGDN